MHDSAAHPQDGVPLELSGRSQVSEDISAFSLGRVRGCYDQTAISRRRRAQSHPFVSYVLETATHDTAALPKLRGRDTLPLPEVAMCGASNAGKSSLLNALLALDASKGPASVNSRPGWTRSIQLFRIYEEVERSPHSLAPLPSAHTPLATHLSCLLPPASLIDKRHRLTPLSLHTSLSLSLLPKLKSHLVSLSSLLAS